MMKKYFVLAVVLSSIFFSVFALAPVSAENGRPCYIVKNSSLFFDANCDNVPDADLPCKSGFNLIHDYDCDGVPDWRDSCPGFFNPDQSRHCDALPVKCTFFPFGKPFAKHFLVVSSLPGFSSFSGGSLGSGGLTDEVVSSSVSSVVSSAVGEVVVKVVSVLDDSAKSSGFSSVVVDDFVKFLFYPEFDVYKGSSLSVPLLFENTDSVEHSVTLSLSVPEGVTYRVEPYHSFVLEPLSARRVLVVFDFDDSFDSPVLYVNLTVSSVKSHSEVLRINVLSPVKSSYSSLLPVLILIVLLFLVFLGFSWLFQGVDKFSSPDDLEKLLSEPRSGSKKSGSKKSGSKRSGRGKVKK